MSSPSYIVLGSEVSYLRHTRKLRSVLTSILTFWRPFLPCFCRYGILCQLRSIIRQWFGPESGRFSNQDVCLVVIEPALVSNDANRSSASDLAALAGITT